MKRKNFVCVFAHPDDEAFGPSGMIYTLTKTYDVYILCATKGQAGKDSSVSEKKLSERRAEELRESAKILGVKNIYFLGFRDGSLSNSLYHKLAAKIEKYVDRLKPEGMLTFGQSGISGHIDHITVSMVASYVFERKPFIKKIMYTEMTKERAEAFGNDYFIYFPEGKPRSKINKILDVSNIWDVKLAAMKCHASQKHDYERILRISKTLPKEEYFSVKKRS